MKTAYIYDPLFLKHNTGTGGSQCKECADRVRFSHQVLSGQDWFDNLIQLQSKPVDLKWIKEIHDERYVRRVEVAYKDGVQYLDNNPDVAISKFSYEVALNVVGSVLAIADQVMSGNVNNGFAMVRPPGHHAEHAEAMGFCLFNSIAVVTRYLQLQHGLDRVLILDWDVHHGNGTQHLFEHDPSVFYVSLHQYPLYPGTGTLSEQGIGKGKGATLNCPMSAGLGEDAYKEAFTEIILPKARRFSPDAILISAGFDAHQDDPLGVTALKSAYCTHQRRSLFLKKLP